MLWPECRVEHIFYYLDKRAISCIDAAISQYALYVMHCVSYATASLWYARLLVACGGNCYDSSRHDIPANDDITSRDG